MARSPGVPLVVRVRAELELRRRRRVQAAAELVRYAVVMPPLDPPLVPPADDLAVEAGAALVLARQDRLSGLMAQWQAGQPR